MSREVSGLRLLLHSPASNRASLNEIAGSQRYLRFGLLLFTVLAGILSHAMLCGRRLTAPLPICRSNPKASRTPRWC